MSIGGLGNIFDIANTTQSNTSNVDINDFGYIQFITQYPTSHGSNVTRVTTIGVQFANPTKKQKGEK